MSQMKTLNGYEIVDQAARNTKQNKVLYGDSDPSSSTGSNGDVYVAFNSASAKSNIVDIIYPVGSIYISTSSTNPSTLFGGTWESFGAGRTLIGAGSGNDGTTSMTFSAGTTGGEYNHKLTVTEMPSHNHIIRTAVSGNTSASSNNYGKIAGAPGNAQFITSDYTQQNFNTTGGGDSHNNIQPYIVTYMWKRIA